MKLSTSTGLILLGCTLVVPLFAFEQGAQSGPPLNQQYPGPNGRANFRKIVSGEFTGNLTRDAVFLDLDTVSGTMEPKLLVSPEYMDTSIGTGSPANDIAVLSGAVAGKDLLVTVGPDGLKLYQRMSLTHSWSVTTVRDGNTIWGNAAFVAVGDVNGDGCPDIVGVPANKRDLIYLWGSCNLTFTDGPTVVNPTQTINELLLANFAETNDDMSNTVEAVMYSNLGWAVREDNGTWRGSGSWTLSPMRGVALRKAGTSPGVKVDRLVNIAVFGGTDRLSIVDETGTEGPYNLGALGIVAMSTGDMTAVSPPTGGAPVPDGDDDLVLTTNTDRDLRIYENQYPNVPTFNFATPTKFKFGAAARNPALNATGPQGITVGDFDGDERLDVLAPGQGDPNPNQTGVWGCVSLIRPNYGYGMFQLGIDDPRIILSTNPGVLPDQIRLTFHPPSTALVPPQGSGWVLDVLIQVYYSPSLGAAPQLTPYAIGHIPVPPTQGFQYYIFDLPLGYSLSTSTGIFSIVAFQELTLNGVMKDRGPAITGMLNPGPNTPVTNVTKDTTQWFGVHREHDDVPTAGAWDQGPTVPPVPEEDEPQEVPASGG